MTTYKALVVEMDARRRQARARIALDPPMTRLEAMAAIATLDVLPRRGREVPAEQVRGRIAIDQNGRSANGLQGPSDLPHQKQ